MKKYTILLFLIFILLGFISCKNESSVEILITPENSEARVGDTISYKIVLNADVDKDGEIGTFKISSQNEVFFTKEFENKTNDSLNFDFIVPLTVFVGEDLLVYFSVTDKNSGITTSKNGKISILQSYKQTVFKENLTLNFDPSSMDKFMMIYITNDEVLLENANSINSDIAFVWDVVLRYCIVSPNSPFINNIFQSQTPPINYSYLNKKQTKIQLYEGSWSDLTNEFFHNLTVTSNTIETFGNGLADIEEGTILLFETQDNRKGAIQVTTNAKTNKYISFNILYQLI
jgi:hypothetical protein